MHSIRCILHSSVCNPIAPRVRPGVMNAISQATGPPAGAAVDRSWRADPVPSPVGAPAAGRPGGASAGPAPEPAGPAPEPEFSVVRTGMSAEEQFRLFAEESTAALHRIAYLLCGDDHRAHDLTQIALERTYRHWSRIKDGNAFAYARRVLATARIDGWRRTRREVLQPPEDVVVTHEASRSPAADSGAQVAERERLVRALRQLGPGQRRVVVLRHLLDRSEAEVAEELGVSVGNVKSQGARGLARLRTLLSEGQDA